MDEIRMRQDSLHPDEFTPRHITEEEEVLKKEDKCNCEI